MKKTIFPILRLSVLALSYFFIFTPGKLHAETEAEAKPKVITHSFPGVSTFMTASGRLGFFEQGTGKIFLYDSNLEKCVFRGQLSKLGEPITTADESEEPKSKSYE